VKTKNNNIGGRKMLRKMLIVLLVATMFVVMAVGCAPSVSTEEPAAEEPAAEEPTAEEPDEEPLKIMFTNAFYSAPYCAPMIAAAEAKAAELGVEIQILDGKADAQTQLDQIQNAIAEGVDGILYFPADQESTVTAVRQLAESGIPCIVINSNVDPSVQGLIGTFIGTDYYQQALVAGQMCLDIANGEAANVVIIEGAGGTEAQKLRSQGFEDTIVENAGITVLAKQQADWDPAKAQKVMEDFIAQFGDDIDIVYTHDDGMYAGAAQALKDAGMLDKVKVISIGGNATGIAAVEAGELYGTASQSPLLEGAMGVEYILKLIAGEELPEWVKVDTVPITAENVADFDGQGW
jgi:ABC-type sugar transport system substrate-binding protein